MKSSGLCLLLSALGVGVVARPQSPFLHEILLGRCYEKPVGAAADPSTCPSVVGSLLGAFAGKLDQEVRTADFQAYLDTADFATPPNGGMLVMGHGADQHHLRIKNHTSPETTKGGALVVGLTLCANDKHENCPGLEPLHDGEFVGAESSLWAGIYEAFAKQVQGQLLMVVLDENADTTLTTKAAIPQLQAGAVSEVDMFLVQGDCATSRAVEQLQSALQEAKISKISCLEDPYLLNLALCTGSLATKDSCQLAKHVNEKTTQSKSNASNIQSNMTMDAAGDDDEEELEEEDKSHFWNTCLVLLLIAAGVVFFLEKQQKYSKPYEAIPQTQLV